LSLGPNTLRVPSKRQGWAAMADEETEEPVTEPEEDTQVKEAFEKFQGEIKRLKKLLEPSTTVVTLNMILELPEETTNRGPASRKLRRILHPDKIEKFAVAGWMTPELEADRKAAWELIDKFMAFEDQPAPGTAPAGWATGARPARPAWTGPSPLWNHPQYPHPCCYEPDEAGEFMCILCRTTTKPAYCEIDHMLSDKHIQRSGPGWEYYWNKNKHIRHIRP
jgi:hypothetical protein